MKPTEPNQAIEPTPRWTVAHLERSAKESMSRISLLTILSVMLVSGCRGSKEETAHTGVGPMKSVQRLIDDFEAVRAVHLEITDTAVREECYRAIRDGFIEQVPGYSLPSSFALFEPDGNRAVRAALARFLSAGAEEALARGYTTPEQRFEAFERSGVISKKGSPLFYFFGSASTYQGAKAAYPR